MNKSLRFLAAAGLIGGGCWVTYAWGQQSTQSIGPADPSVQREPVAIKRPDAPGWAPPPSNYGVDVGPQSPFGRPTGGGGAFGRGMWREIPEMQAFQAAVEKLRSAKEGTEKEAAKKELLQRLEQSFTRDLEHREQEVAEIESRVKKLREQLERRKKAKDEIVGLRLKTIVNESEGLGFSGPLDLEPTGKRPATGPTPGPVPPSYDAFSPRPAVVPDDGR
jgi:hypothetical protein